MKEKKRGCLDIFSALDSKMDPSVYTAASANLCSFFSLVRVDRDTPFNWICLERKSLAQQEAITRLFPCINSTNPNPWSPCIDLITNVWYIYWLAHDMNHHASTPTYQTFLLPTHSTKPPSPPSTFPLTNSNRFLFHTDQTRNTSPPYTAPPTVVPTQQSTANAIPHSHVSC